MKKCQCWESVYVYLAESDKLYFIDGLTKLEYRWISNAKQGKQNIFIITYHGREFINQPSYICTGKGIKIYYYKYDCRVLRTYNKINYQVIDKHENNSFIIMENKCYTTTGIFHFLLCCSLQKKKTKKKISF